MSKSTITMSDEAHALAVYASIAGRTTSTELLSQDRDGEEQTTERKTQEVIANTAQFEKAKSLVGKLRAALARHATNVEPLGYITDPGRLAEFKVEIANTEREIDAHNAEMDQAHPIRYDVLVLPIGRVLDEKSQRRLCATVTEELTNARTMLKAGDVKGLGAWIQHRKNLGSLMPSIVGRVVDAAITQLTDERKRFGKLLKADFTPERAALEMQVDQVDDALAWVETSLSGVTASGEAVQ